MAKKKTVLFESDEAAVYEERVLKGWWSGSGSGEHLANRFFGEDERSARYTGCTHRRCECGNIHSKYYLSCPACRAKRDRERFVKFPEVDWDEKTPICIYGDDRFFFDPDDLNTYCEDADCEHGDLMLVLCEPVKLRLLEPDYWEDDLAEDCDVPDAVYEAIKELNEVIAEQPPAYWRPGKTRVKWQGYINRGGENDERGLLPPEETHNKEPIEESAENSPQETDVDCCRNRTDAEIFELLAKLEKHGGAIVSSDDCPEIETANARLYGRFAVNADGFGFVLRTADWLTNAHGAIRAASASDKG